MEESTPAARLVAEMQAEGIGVHDRLEPAGVEPVLARCVRRPAYRSQ